MKPRRQRNTNDNIDRSDPLFFFPVPLCFWQQLYPLTHFLTGDMQVRWGTWTDTWSTCETQCRALQLVQANKYGYSSPSLCGEKAILLKREWECVHPPEHHLLLSCLFFALESFTWNVNAVEKPHFLACATNLIDCTWPLSIPLVPIHLNHIISVKGSPIFFFFKYSVMLHSTWPSAFKV